MRDALLLVDVVNDFRHEDGEALLDSFRTCQPHLLAALEDARGSIPVVYANDDWGRWDGNLPAMVHDAVEHGLGGELVGAVAPRAGEPIVLKPRYSAFDSTPLRILLERLGVERLLLAGMATEMCVTQTAIAARELGYKVTVLADACAGVDERLERRSRSSTSAPSSASTSSRPHASPRTAWRSRRRWAVRTGSPATWRRRARPPPR